MQRIQIVSRPSESQPYAVIYKPAGMPSAPLAPGDTDNACYHAIRHYPELASVAGHYKSFEHGILHRLDTITEGLLLIAATQPAYESLRAAQAAGEFIKEYDAVCVPAEERMDGFPAFAGTRDRITSRFRAYGRGGAAVRPVTDGASAHVRKKCCGKEYTTHITWQKPLENGLVLAHCAIFMGFRHQVRCHLAWAGLPIAADPLYCPEGAGKGLTFSFRASALRFPHPLTGETVHIKA